MSLVYSVGATRYEASKFVVLTTWAANLKAYLDTYEAASLASGSTIFMYKPTKGSKWAGFGQLAWDDLSGTSTYTLSVGIGVDLAGNVAVVDKFLAATSAVAAADKIDLDAGATAISALGYEFDGGTYVTLTTAGSATDATGTISLLFLCLEPS